MDFENVANGFEAAVVETVTNLSGKFTYPDVEPNAIERIFDLKGSTVAREVKINAETK